MILNQLINFFTRYKKEKQRRLELEAELAEANKRNEKLREAYNELSIKTKNQIRGHKSEVTKVKREQKMKA